MTGFIKQAWLESGGVYGYRKIHDDLRSIGETCCPKRVWRLARPAGLKAQPPSYQWVYWTGSLGDQV